jgi:hypothetical protein
METAFQLGSVGIILGAPLANSSGLIQFAPLENIGIRLALILLVVASTRLSPLTTCLTSLAVFSLFMERNFTVLASLPNQQPHFPDSRQGIPVKANPLPAIKETLTYMDHDSDGLAVAETHGSEGGTTEKLFEETSDLQDSNPRLPEGPTSDQAPSFFTSHRIH